MKAEIAALIILLGLMSLAAAESNDGVQTKYLNVTPSVWQNENLTIGANVTVCVNFPTIYRMNYTLSGVDTAGNVLWQSGDNEWSRRTDAVAEIGCKKILTMSFGSRYPFIREPDTVGIKFEVRLRDETTGEIITVRSFAPVV